MEQLERFEEKENMQRKLDHANVSVLLYVFLVVNSIDLQVAEEHLRMATGYKYKYRYKWNWIMQMCLH